MTDQPKHHQQIDWVGYSEFPPESVDTCPVCHSVILNLPFGAGRPSVYCSDACKMKAYRRRNKQTQSLRNSIEDKPYPDSFIKPCSRIGWYGLNRFIPTVEESEFTSFEYNPSVSVYQATNPTCSERKPLYHVFRHIDNGRIVVFQNQKSVTKQRFFDYETALDYVECLFLVRISQ